MLFKSYAFELLVKTATPIVNESQTCTNHSAVKDIDSISVNVSENHEFAYHCPDEIKFRFKPTADDNMQTYRDTSFTNPEPR